MIVVGNLFIAVASVLGWIITAYTWVLIARCILSFVSPDPRNPIVQFIYNVTEPLMAKVRNKMPQFGMLDLSPIVVLIGLQIVQVVVANSLIEYGTQLKGIG